MSVTEHRVSRRERVAAFFTANLGERFESRWLHYQFGSAFRSRVSEVNRDVSATITIRNGTVGTDHSYYWSELRKPVETEIHSTAKPNQGEMFA